MTHVFVAPHPDDVALSCGGLVASLRELGQNVAIVTVYSGSGNPTVSGLTDYQRAALGFGSKANWPLTEAFRPTNIAPDFPVEADRDRRRPPALDGRPRPDRCHPAASEHAGSPVLAACRVDAQRQHHQLETDARPLADGVGGQGSLVPIDFAAADAMQIRKAEEERYAFFAELSVIFLDLPDAVYRGYVRATTSCWARCATTTTRRTSCCARRSCASSRRWSTSRSASAATSTTSCAARWAWRCWRKAGGG